MNSNTDESSKEEIEFHHPDSILSDSRFEMLIKDCQI